MKYYLLFLVVFLLSCSKKVETGVLDDTFDNIKMVESTDEQKYEILENYENNSINISPQINHKEILHDFSEHPIISENIVIPNHYGYNSYDELINHLGNPIKEFTSAIHGFYLEGGNYFRGFEYEYYAIGTLYVASKDTVYTYFIWINMDDRIMYNYNINKYDTPTKIIEIFGLPNSIMAINENMIEYCYFASNNNPQINFQFTNEELTSIIFHLMP